MKRKAFVLSALFMLGSVFSYSWIHVDLTVSIDDPEPIIPSHGKGPVYIPTLWQEGYEFLFDDLSVDCTLQLTDGNGIVVYSTFVPAGTTQVVLPSTLSGSYKLCLADGTYYYIGYINL